MSETSVTSSMTDIFQRIQALLDQHGVIVFMKGTPHHPMCGFSRTVVSALTLLHVPFHSVDILQDPELRHGLKAFSHWPTFPQLYVDRKLIGGCDIIREMLESGELETLLASHCLPPQS